QVRTNAFKKWFGDWELPLKKVKKIKAEIDHKLKNFAEAIQWGKENIARVYSNKETGGKGEINISKNAIEKFFSGKAVNKSASEDVQKAVLKVLPKVIKESIIGETHPDKNGDSNIKDIQRLFGCVTIDDKDYRVKITVKRYNTNNEKSKAYSYEVTEIELFEGKNATPRNINADNVPTSNNSITIANLLKNVKSSKDPSKNLLDYSKIVDENGEPKVVYHQTNSKETINIKTGENFENLDWADRMYWLNEASQEEFEKEWTQKDFTIFNNRFARTTNELPAFFFAPEYDEYHEYGERTIPAFLNIRKPAISPNFHSMGFDRGTRDGIMADAMDYMIKQGYDGIINTEENEPYEYLAFYPNQIKSATNNTGEFSTEDDIEFSIGGNSAGAELTTDNNTLTPYVNNELADAIFYHNMVELKINPNSNKTKEIAFSYGDIIYFYKTKNGLSSTLLEAIPIEDYYIEEIKDKLLSLNGTDQNTKRLIRYLATSTNNNTSNSDILGFIASNGQDGRNVELDNLYNKSNRTLSNRERNSNKNSQDAPTNAISQSQANDILTSADARQDKAYGDEPIVDDIEFSISNNTQSTIDAWLRKDD
ncbi:MAG: hypothetical protein HUK18_02805, partial [Bacteroidales bacterium]|nr:hypothetical protein [Bacteroidales bacterium]